MSHKQNRELEDNPMWQKANDVSQALREVMTDIPDEEYVVSMRLRDRTIGLTVGVAEVLGTTEPQDVLRELSTVRRDVFGLKGAYLSLHKLELVEVDPDIIVAINELIALIDDYKEKNEKEQAIKVEQAQ